MSTVPALKKDFDPAPVLDKAYREGREQNNTMNQMFELLGWGMLPLELKYAIRDDVKGVVDELKGQYASCDPYVKDRRKRVIYWVESYMNGICSASTAVRALAY